MLVVREAVMLVQAAVMLVVRPDLVVLLQAVRRVLAAAVVVQPVARGATDAPSKPIYCCVAMLRERLTS